MIIRIILACIFVATAGCTRDPASNTEPPPPSSRGMYVLNEGLYLQGNATLSYVDLETHRVTNDVFFAVNGRDLGDAASMIAIRGNLGYIVVSNSHKIEIFDITTNQSVGTIDMGAGRSPLQLAFVNDTLGMVTNLFDSSVVFVDLRNRSLQDRVEVGSNPDGIAVAAGKAFVANTALGEGRTISIINLTTRTLVRTIEVGDNPSQITATPTGLLYILCAGFYGNFGDPSDDTPAKIFVMQPESEVVVDSILIGGHAFKMAFGPSDDGYVPTSDSVVVLDIRFHRVTGTLAQGDYYGVAVDPVSGTIYISDARGFVTPGVVYAYTTSGQRVKEYSVGLIPGSFAFKQ